MNRKLRSDKHYKKPITIVIISKVVTIYFVLSQ